MQPGAVRVDEDALRGGASCNRDTLRLGKRLRVEDQAVLRQVREQRQADHHEGDHHRRGLEHFPQVFW